MMINFPFRTAFASMDFRVLCFYFHLFQGISDLPIVSSLNQWFFSSILFSLRVFVYFPTCFSCN